MKFSHSIQFNAVPDWSSYYLAYSNLKKLIYHLEKTKSKSGSGIDDPERSLLIQDDTSPDKIFQKALDLELEKISSFYHDKKLELIAEIADLLNDEEKYKLNLEHIEGHEGSTLNIRGHNLDLPRNHNLLWRFQHRRRSTFSESIDELAEDSDDIHEEDAPLRKPRRYSKLKRDLASGRSGNPDERRGSLDFNKIVRRYSQSCEDFDNDAITMSHTIGITLKRQSISLYVQLCELKSFVMLNRTGFLKVLKKYDKILERNLKSEYMESRVSCAEPFQLVEKAFLEENVEKVEQVYANIVTNGDLNLSKRELRLNLREHVVWERNTVWREMIGIERKAQAANFGLQRTILIPDNNHSRTQRQGDDDFPVTKREIITPYGKLLVPKYLLSSTTYSLLFIVFLFLILLNVPMNLRIEQQNCLAMLVFVSLLWATEVIPLFVTSLMIPFLCVLLRVVRSSEKPQYRLEPNEAAKFILAAMWTPVIMLLLGGFSIAAALSKYDIARRIATFVLSKAGKNPATVLVTTMFVAAFASMWISNVAAPVLCFSIIQPLLRNLPSDSQMSKALILGIALASNVGGMLSPIASPQNIVAIQIMQPAPSWGIWFFIALPVGIISILLIWVILLVSFQPSRGTVIVPIRAVKDKFTAIQWFISVVTLLTIILWCVSHQLEWLFGDMGIVALIPIILFFGTGVLSKEDFNNFLWTIIILAAGGLSLGTAVHSSGLLHTIAGMITSAVEGFSLYVILIVFSTLILVVATFISHTVAALIILPLVHSVGMSMEEPHPNLLVMGGALMCSAAMGLPTSGFPNMTAIMMENPQTGQRYLQVKHFLTKGVPSSIIALLVVLTVGYFLMSIAGL
ncbi:putative transporter [Podosphaera aphanis]|nr:putative transporter [Podosphaera aphanis]